MSEAGRQKIREARLCQSQSELDRKAEKAAERKGKLWTQEELDSADKEAREFAAFEISDYLEDEAVITEYLLAAGDDPDPEVLLRAKSDVVKARAANSVCKALKAMHQPNDSLKRNEQ
jgi:hypothetical protein